MPAFVKLGPKVALRLLACFVAWSLLCSTCAIAADSAAVAATDNDTKRAAGAAKAPRPTEVLLPNGLKLLLLEDHSFPVVSCLAWYKVGSRNERNGTTGLTHLLEHMLFGHVGSFRRGEIGASIARLGGQFNGYTSDDFTTFFETLPSNKWELALRIESERMRQAKFTDAAVQEEINNIQREFENEAKDPMSSLTQEVRSLLYASHPYHNPTMGWRSDVEGLTAHQLKAYYDLYFWPNNCTLVLAGDFDSKHATQLVQRYFGALPKSPKPVPQLKFDPEPARPERHSVVRHASSKEILAMAFNGPPFSHADAPAMVVLEKLLSAPSAGRLKTKLIEARLCSAATCAFEAKRDPGYIAITCTAIPATANAQQRITETIDGVIAQIRNQPVSDAELQRAKNQAEFAYYSEREGPYRAGFHLGYFDNLAGWKGSWIWPERIRTVTAEDIQRVANKYLTPESRVVSWLAGSAAKPATAKPTEPSAPPSRTSPSKPEHVRLTGYKEDDNASAPGGKTGATEAASDAAASGSKLELPVPAASVTVSDGGGKSSSSDTKDKPEEVDRSQASTAPDAATDPAPATGTEAKHGASTVISAGSQATNESENKSTGQQLIKQTIEQVMPGALVNAVQKLPSAVGSAPSSVVKELPNAVEAVPAVIKNLPSAVGSIPSVIKQLPSTLGGVPSAIKEIPGALGHMPGAAANVVKDLPSTIGGIPGSAASAIRELPSAIGGIPGATAGAIKSVPAALGTFGKDLGGIPGAIGRQLAGASEHRLTNGTACRTLKNGITLVVHPSQLTPVVQVVGAVRAGSVYEPVSKRGLSSVTAQLLNQGTAQRGVAQVVSQQEDLGIQPFHMLKFDGDSETIQFSTRCLSRDLSKQFELIAETLATPSLEEDNFEKAKQETVTEAQRFEDTNGRKAERALYRSLLAQGSPFSPEDPSEMVKSVGTLTLADQRKFINNYVVPSATTIVVVGDIDPDRAVQLAEKAFGIWSGKGVHPKIIAHVSTRQVLRTAVPTKDRTKTTIGFGKLIPVPTCSADYSNMLIADAIFSKHPLFSRLGQKISQDTAFGRAVGGDSIDTTLTPMAETTAWSFAIEVESNMVPVTVSALQNQLSELSSNGVKPQEFVEAKRYLLGAIPVKTMSTLGSAARALLSATVHSPDRNPNSNLVANLKATNLDSVNRLIKHTLKPDTATMIVVGNSQALRSTRSRVTAQTAKGGKEEDSEQTSGKNKDDGKPAAAIEH